MCYGWGSETGFFPRYFVVTHRLGKNPVSLSGFFVGVRGVQKPGFFRDPSLSPTDLVKTRFLVGVRGVQKPGFFRDPSLSPTDLVNTFGFASVLCRSR